MLVGNKVDMGSKRAVTYQEGKSLGIYIQLYIQHKNMEYNLCKHQLKQQRILINCLKI